LWGGAGVTSVAHHYVFDLGSLEAEGCAAFAAPPLDQGQELGAVDRVARGALAPIHQLGLFSDRQLALEDGGGVITCGRGGLGRGDV